MSEIKGHFVAEKTAELINKGVKILSPWTVEVDSAVNPDLVDNNVVIHAGCRIRGERTAIGPGCVIGEETPATLENCQLEKNVMLKGGFFSGSVFLNGANVGSGAHVRPDCLLEEEANGAHSVGIKQTILLSYVTLGSLINFCDCLMAGGTDRKHHSEVGSSYIHFNYTPHGDKATPSLIGDVPRGVMLNCAPIFLGGQGGLVGPARIEYGSVIPAGNVCRKDVLSEGTLFSSNYESQLICSRPYNLKTYGNINRLITNNLIYIGNLQALKEWYRFARKSRMDSNMFSRVCYESALLVIDRILKERIKRLGEVAEKLVESVRILDEQSFNNLNSKSIAVQKSFISDWPYIEEQLKKGPSANAGKAERSLFLKDWESIDLDIEHTKAVAALSNHTCSAGSLWLQSIVDSTSSLWGYK